MKTVKFNDLVLPKEAVVLPDSLKTGKLQHIFKSMPFTYTDENGNEQHGTYSITFLENGKYDAEIIPKNLPDGEQVRLWNCFFGQYNLIYNEVIPRELKMLT